jgi:predicted nucleic acid-binding protein
VILVDTAIWIDHLHAVDSSLVELLRDDEAGCHPLVIEELALGSIKQRDVVLDLLTNLQQFSVLTHDEVMELIGTRLGKGPLWGRGLSVVDVSLLGSVLVSGDARLWTRDRRLKEISQEMGVVFDEF